MTSSTHRMRRGLALATVVTALAAPAASAMPVDPQGVNEGYTAGDLTPLPPSPERTVASDGFDWGDAGIGAAATLAIGAIGAGAALAAGHLPSRGTVGQRAH